MHKKKNDELKEKLFKTSFEFYVNERNWMEKEKQQQIKRSKKNDFIIFKKCDVTSDMSFVFNLSLEIIENIFSYASDHFILSSFNIFLKMVTLNKHIIESNWLDVAHIISTEMCERNMINIFPKKLYSTEFSLDDLNDIKKKYVNMPKSFFVYSMFSLYFPYIDDMKLIIASKCYDCLECDIILFDSFDIGHVLGNDNLCYECWSKSNLFGLTDYIHQFASKKPIFKFMPQKITGITGQPSIYNLLYYFHSLHLCGMSWYDIADKKKGHKKQFFQDIFEMFGKFIQKLFKVFSDELKEYDKMEYSFINELMQIIYDENYGDNILETCELSDF